MNFVNSTVSQKQSNAEHLMRCIIYSPHWLRTILLFVVKSAFYILTLAWGFRRCSFRLTGQCEGLSIVERVTEQAPRFFVCISEWISSTRESVDFIVYGIRMNILQNNPYRQLGVYSNSPTKERLANHNRMKAFLKVGKSVSFPLDVPQYLSSINRTEASAADAEAKLTLPKDQILHAQFWFIKTTPLDEVAFNHLFAGEIDKAEEIWQKRECLSALQNRIVCALIRNRYDSAIKCAEVLYGNTQYLNQFVSTIIGTGGNFDVSNLAFSFLDILCDEIGASKLLPFIANSSWKEHIGEKAVKPLIDSIQEAINIAQKTKGKGSNARLNAGETLRRNTRNAILQLKGFLSTKDLQYQMIADKLGLEILQCGIDYFNDSEEPDAAHKAMSLQKYAKSIAVGQMAKDKNGNIGIVTAGHFIKVNDILKDSANVEIGKCLYSKEEYYVDAAFCSITSKKHAPTNKIKFMKDLQKDTLSIALAQPPKGSWINMVGMVSKRSSGTIFNASYDVPNSAQKTIYKDVILAKYTSNSGDSGGIVYALTKATNTRYTVGINLGSITYNGITYGACIKAYLINQTFGLTRY